MKKVLLVLIALSLIGCLGGSKDKKPAVGNVFVEGDVRNTSVAWHNYLPDFFNKAFAATFISTRSTLNDITDPERYADVSISTGIVVEAEVINNLPSQISGYKVDILVEDEGFLTKEEWHCQVCYPNNAGGHNCQTLWEVKGNNMFETDPAPTLPLCQAGSGGQQDLCVTAFPDGVNCSAPSYDVVYYAPGDGLWKATIDNLTVDGLSSVINALGVQDGGWITGTDKYARFTVYDQNSVQVHQKDYVFNVVN